MGVLCVRNILYLFIHEYHEAVLRRAETELLRGVPAWVALYEL